MKETVGIERSDLLLLFEGMAGFEHEAGPNVLEVWPAFAEALIREVRDAELDQCDHSVGICGCAFRDAVGNISLALEGRRSCPDCGGDGLSVAHPTAEGEIGTCAACDGRGTKALETEARS